MPPDNDVQKEIEQLERRYAEHSQGLVFAHLADAYRRAGEYGKAEGLILHGLKHHPKYISAYNVLGRVYVDSERYSDAHEQFTKVLELDSQNMIAMKALGELAVRGGRLEDARSWFERILQIDPRNEEVQQELQKLVDAGVSPARGAAAPPESPAEPIAPAEIAELEEPEFVGAGEAVEWELDEPAEGPEEEEVVEFSAEPVEGLIGKGQQVELGDAADVADAMPDIALEGLDEFESSEGLPEEERQLEGLEALEALDSPPQAEAPATGRGSEINLGDMEEWTPGFLREEDLKGRAGDDLGVGSLREEFRGGEEAVPPADVLGDDESGYEPEGSSLAAEGMLTETMAELYADQGLFEDALGVYRELAKARPNDQRLKARIAELKQQLAEARAEPEVDDLASLLELTDIETPEEEAFPEAPAFPGEPEFYDAPTAVEEQEFFEAALASEETQPPAGVFDAPAVGIGEPRAPSPDAAAAGPPRQVRATGEFEFADEAPVAGMDHLDPFAASFDVMVQRGEAAPMAAGVGGLGDLTRGAPSEAPEPELEIVPTIEEMPTDLHVAPAADVLPPGADVITPAEPDLYLAEAPAPEVVAPVPAAEAPAPPAPRAQPAGASTIEEYLSGLLAFTGKRGEDHDPGAQAAAPPAEPSASSDAAGAGGAAQPPEGTGSEDLEQFQEWLRGLKE